MTATSPATSGTDRIEKRVLLKAPRSRVWRALTDSREFGAWFQASLDGPFRVGGRVRGHVTGCGHGEVLMELIVERIEPEWLFSYRWHPYAEDRAVHAAEPTTLVEFRLSDGDGGTVLEILESGFDALPPKRRAEAFRGNEGGWTMQVANLERYVAGQ